MEISPEELEATKKMILEMCLCKNCPTYGRTSATS